MSSAAAPSRPLTAPLRALRQILILDPDAGHREALHVALAQRGFRVVSASDLGAAQRELTTRDYGCVVCDRLFVTRLDTTATIVAIGESLDAYDWVAKPVHPNTLEQVIARVDERVALMRDNAFLRERLRPPTEPPSKESAVGDMVGTSEPMRRVFSEIRKIAQYKTNVLISGESGTGKELVARAMHDQSPRRGGPFVAINCGAIPPTLLESELFGHVKGAFTDAVRDKRGLFEEAHDGTLFLDEIGELPLELQVKLLRALQEEEIRPVGSNLSIPVDTRVVSATVRQLDDDVKVGRFREDLYYRLNVVPLRLPPLRERKDDIPALVEHFIGMYSFKHASAGMGVERIEDEAIALLQRYDWPGNIRELENTVERAMVLCEGDVITAELLGERIQADQPSPVAAVSPAELSIKKSTRSLERHLIERALAKTGGNRTTAAKLLEISHRALLYKIKQYGL